MSKATQYVIGAYLSFDVAHSNEIGELAPELQRQAYARAGSIRQLVSVHNELCDKATELKGGNKKAVNTCLSTLAHAVMQKSAAFTEFVRIEIDSVRIKAERKGAKKVKKSNAKKRKAKKSDGKKAKAKSGKPIPKAREKVKAKSKRAKQ